MSNQQSVCYFFEMHYVFVGFLWRVLMDRKIARELCFKLLFQFEFFDESLYGELMEFFWLDMEDVSVFDRNCIQNKVIGVVDNLNSIDSYLSDFSKDWSIERMSPIDRSILRLAVYEMLFDANIPVGVSINEAVELAKCYGEDMSFSFVNGILGAISKKLAGDKL